MLSLLLRRAQLSFAALLSLLYPHRLPHLSHKHGCLQTYPDVFVGWMRQAFPQHNIQLENMAAGGGLQRGGAGTAAAEHKSCTFSLDSCGQLKEAKALGGCSSALLFACSLQPLPFPWHIQAQQPSLERCVWSQTYPWTPTLSLLSTHTMAGGEAARN